MKFSDIPGLSAIKNQLIKAVKSEKIAHAQLYFGLEGSLTLPMVLAYTTYIHCENKQKEDACGTCPACHKNEKYIHPDTLFTFPFSKSGSSQGEHKINMLPLWRSFLCEQPFGKSEDWIHAYGGEDKHVSISREQSQEIIRTLALKPFESTYKINIIWQPETMHTAAINSLLKIIEEPPPNTCFFLVSNAPEKLLPTIQSRVQAIRIPLLSDHDINLFLEKKFQVGQEWRKTVVQLAEGDLNRSLQLLESAQEIDQSQLITWMKACLQKDYSELVNMADRFHKMDKLEQQNMLHYSTTMMREAMLYLADANTISRLTEQDTPFVHEFSESLTFAKIEKLNTITSQYALALRQHASAKMIFLSLSLHYATILHPSSSNIDIKA